MSIDQIHLPFRELDDTELFNILNIDKEHSFPLSVIDNYIFHPFSYNDDYHDYLVSYGINEPVCNYYFCDDLESNINLMPSNLNFLSYNISSIPLHLDTFSDQCLDTINNTMNILGFCETRLNDEISSLYSLNGYNTYLNNKSTKGGGVALYIKKKLKGIIHLDLSLQLPYIESLFVQC